MSKRINDLAFKYNIGARTDELSLFVSEIYDDGFSAPKKAIHIAYIRCTGLDELITKDSEAIYKLIRKFVQDERGNFTLQEREYIPPMDKSEWIGRYEQGEDKDGENAYKHLYIPISIIKAGVYNNDILGYKHDKRYLETCQKYIGFRGFRCAKFDLGALDD